MYIYLWLIRASLLAQMVENPPAMRETWVQTLGWEDPWRRAWQLTPVFLPGESPWTEESGRLKSTGSQRVGHECLVGLSIYTADSLCCSAETDPAV